MMISALTKPNLSHRVLAIVAMIVLLTGKAAHNHSKCTDCRDSESHSETQTTATNIAVTPSLSVMKPAQVSCSFGCDHQVAPLDMGNQPAKDLPSHGDNESSCVMCDVLAAVPDNERVTRLPEWTNLVQSVVPAKVSLPETIEAREIRLRGPPTA